MSKVRARSFPPRRLRRTACVCAFAAALLAGSSAPAATEVWVGGASGNWSSSANWQDGSAPAAGGDPAQIIHFTYPGSSALTFTNDLAGTYVLNQLQLDLSAATAPTLAGNALQFGGASPVLGLNGTAGATISENLVLNPSSGAVTITGSGSGGVTLSGIISETGGARSLVIAATPSSSNVQNITLSNTNTFTGGVRLQSGNLVLSAPSNALGTGVLTAAGGTLKFGNSNVFTNNVSLEQRLVIGSTLSGPFSSFISGTISSAVAGTGIDMRMDGNFLNLSSAATYSGTTTVDKSTVAAQAATAAGTLQLTSAVNSPSFTISSGGTLSLSASGSVNRIGDTAQIILRGGQLTYDGSLASGAAQVETVGALSGAGVATVTVANSSGVSVRVAASSLARVERGTFNFTGSSLGSAFGGSVGNVLFTTAPAGLTGGGGTGLNTSILPYATATDTTTGLTGFATYSASTGVRKLNEATEYATNFGTASATTSLLIAGTLPNSLPRTINSLSITGTSLTGTGTVNLTSGAVLVNATGTATIENNLAFDVQEGFIHAFSPLVITGALSGSNGLTIGGNSNGSVELAASNNIAGPITINAGQLIFSSAAALGGDTSPIIIGNQNAGFQYKGVAAFTMPRPVETHTGVAFLQNSGGDLTLGAVSGNGGLRFGGAGRFILSAGSTYTGPTAFGTATVQLGADSALGNGGAVDFGGGTVQLSGNWTTARELSISAASTLDTAGFTATWTGELLSSGRLTKAGQGELAVTGRPNYTGPVTVAGGAVRLAGGGGLRTASFTVNTGAELVVDNSAVNSADRVNNGATVTLNGGGFRLLGNSAAAASETIGSFAGSWGTVNLASPGSSGTTLHLANGAGNLPGLLLRGTNLGGATGTAFTRIVCDTNGPSLLPLQPRVVVDSSPTGTGEFFAFYDTTSDAAGVIGYRAMRASEYTSGSVIQNPANGGTTPAFAHFVATGDLTVSGAANVVDSLTVPGNLTLATGQTLTIAWSGLLARAAAAPTTITGGTIAFSNIISSTAGNLYTGGDVTLTSTITGTNGFMKSGPGQLEFDGIAAYTGGTSVAAGTLRIGANDPMALQAVSVGAGATLSFAASTARLGGLTGAGSVVAPSTLTLGRAGTGFNGAFLGTVDLVLDGGNSAAGYSFGAANPFSGTVTLNGGELSLTNSPFGSTPVVINGGALSGGGNTIATPLQLHTALTVVGQFSLTLAPGATLSGATDVVLRGAGGLTIQIPLVQTGQLRSLYSPEYDYVYANPNPGTITVGGAAGTVQQATAVQLMGGILKLDNAATFTGGAGGRLGDAIPVELNGATLALTGNALVAITESVGALSGLGYAGLTMTPIANSTTRLLPSSISRTDRGTFLLTATVGVLGTSATLNAGKIILPSAPAMIGGGGTLTATSIVPWAITSVASTFGLVTYDANGFRPLAANEYVTALTGAAATANVQLTGASTNTATQTINALSLAGTVPSVSGTGKLTITSGVLLHNVAATTTATLIQIDLDFGAAEAQIYLPAAAPLTLQGVLTGSGGLTKSGPGGLTLSAQNTFTGPVTVNSGFLTVPSLAGLGTGTSPITLNGTSAGLVFSGTAATTLSRPLRLGGGISTLSGAALTVDGTVSGPGGLYVLGSVVLGPGNTYTGPTQVAGTLTIADDSSLGSGTGLFIGNSTGVPTLRLNGDWITSRRIEFQFQSLQTSVAINTNGHDATLNGELAQISRPALIKTGSGSLTLTTASGYASAITVNGGALRLSGAGSLATTSYTIGGDGIVLDNTAVANGNRLADTSALALTSSLSLLGNANAPISETIGPLSVSGTTTLSLTAPGNVSTILSGGTLTKTGTLFVQGDQLGGGPTGGFTRVIFATVPASTILASTSAAGGPFAIATYDTTSDAAGIIGFRQLRAAEYTTGSEIRNPADGGSTALTANMRLAGVTTVGASAATVSTLTFTGSSSLALSAGQTLTLQTGGVVVEPGASATISGGTLAFAGETPLFHTEGDLTLRSTLPATSLRKSGPGQLFFETPYAGSVTLLGGTVHVGANDPLGKAALILNAGATLDFDNRPANLASLNSAGTVLLHGSTLRPTGALTVTGGDLSGTGGFEARAAVSLQAPISNTGPLTVIGNGGTSPRITLTLTGNGTALAASGLTGLAASEVYLDNTNTVLSRVGAVPVALNGSNLTVAGNLTTPLEQDFGALTATGAVTITANVATYSSTQTRQAVTVRISDLIRNDHATLFFYGGTDYSLPSSPAVGGGQAAITLGSGLTSALVGANTTATNHPVLPFAYVHPTAGYNLVTYDSVNGIRGLRADEFSTALTAGDNVDLTTSQVNNADLPINSLKAENYLTGTGTLSVASGLVLSTGSLQSIQNNLSFGTTEAVFLTGSALIVSGRISGSAGLTKGGAGSLNLTGANTFTGPITVNEGTLFFNDMGSLGADTSEIVLNDTAMLVPNTGGVTLTRGVRLNGFSQASISGQSPGNFVIGAPITGTGQLFVNSGNVAFTTANTFAGNLTVGGTLTFGGDAMLGGGTQVALNSGGKLVLSAPWTTSRTLAVNGTGSATVDTAGFDASIAKLTSQFSSASLIKAGAGLLTLPDATGFFGGMSVTGGEVRLNGPIPDNATGTLAVSAGATLSGSLQSTRTVVVFGTLSPGDGVGPMSTGILNFQPNSTLSLELASAGSYDQLNVTGSVTLTGTVQLALTLGVVNLGDTFTVILNDGNDPVSGLFTYGGTTLNEGAHFQVGGQELVISYVGGTGNDVVISVPEPASAAFLLFGGVALATRRRRTNSRREIPKNSR